MAASERLYLLNFKDLWRGVRSVLSTCPGSWWWSPLPHPTPSIGPSGLLGPDAENWSREGLGSDELGTQGLLVCSFYHGATGLAGFTSSLCLL